jgi:hypothetical protein
MCGLSDTIRQKIYIKELAKILIRTQTDIIREAVHYWLKEKGIDDGLIFDEEELLAAYERGRDGMRTEAEDVAAAAEEEKGEVRES